MKLKIIIAAVALVLLGSCQTPYRATDTGAIISTSAQRSFNNQYPNATNINWTSYNPDVVVLNDWEFAGWQTITESDYAVQFDQDNERYYAWYDVDGTWIGSAYVVNDHTRLPVYVTTTLSDKYPTYTISRVNRAYYKDGVWYDVLLKGTDNNMLVMIDENGNVIRYKMK